MCVGLCDWVWRCLFVYSLVSLCVCVPIFVGKCVCVCVGVWGWVSKSLCQPVCLCVSVCDTLCVSVFGCVSVSLSGCVSVCESLCVCVYEPVCEWVCECVCLCVGMWVSDAWPMILCLGSDSHPFPSLFVRLTEMVLAGTLPPPSQGGGWKIGLRHFSLSIKY